MIIYYLMLYLKKQKQKQNKQTNKNKQTTNKQTKNTKSLRIFGNDFAEIKYQTFTQPYQKPVYSMPM